MRYLYDLLSKFIKKKKTAKLVYKAVSSSLFFILAAVVVILLIVRIKHVGFDFSGSIFILCIIYFLYRFFDELFFPIRYLHISHNREIMRVVRSCEGKLSLRNPHGKDVFSCTFDNDAYIDCTYEKGKYTFTVKNDEWDDVCSFECGDQDFEQTLDDAAKYAASLEKKPDGEYDESLMPEQDPDAGEEYFEDEEDDDEEDEEE